MSRTRRAWSLLLSCTFAVVATGCPVDPCQEPDPRGSGGDGDECLTTTDCAEGLACLGTDFFASALCRPVSALPGGADPGCLEHADDWSEHEAHGVQPTGDDDQGCERLVFVSGCNCEASPVIGECLPLMPFYRREIWRRCEGCCWRLVSFWQDDGACDDEG